MRWDFPDKEIIPQEFRMLMRSRHIYILFSSLIHILLGLYWQTHKTSLQKYLQLLGSMLLIISSILFVGAFVYETYQTHSFSEISRQALYLTLAGTIVHAISKIGRK
jgi:high-affinity Fe2+/Pb2+ permease